MCLSLKSTKWIRTVLHSGWGKRKNSKGKEDLSCGCLSSLKHIYFCSWVSIIQHVITKYLQHTKHSCGTVNTKNEKKKNLFSEFLQKFGEKVKWCYTRLTSRQDGIYNQYKASRVAQWKRIHLQRRRCRFKPWSKKIPWRRKWKPTPIFLPGKSHGQQSWWARVLGVTEELDMT